MRSLIAALVLSVLAPIAAHAQTSTPGLSPNADGFDTLRSLIGDQTGAPLTDEFPTPNGEVLQITEHGLMYWSDSHAPTWTNGWLHVALAPNDQTVQWEGEALDPPPPVFTAASTATAIGFGLSPRAYLFGTYPGLAARIDCIVTGESQWTPNARNPMAWGRWGEHASGLAQFLPSTWATTPQGRAGRSLWDPIAAIDAAAWMLQAGRGREFAGVAWGRC